MKVEPVPKFKQGDMVRDLCSGKVGRVQRIWLFFTPPGTGLIYTIDLSGCETVAQKESLLEKVD